MVGTHADHEVDVIVDLEGNSAHAHVVERRELSIDDLFVDGKLRLWEDEHGREGYVETEVDAPAEYYYVDSREGPYCLRRQPVDVDVVRRTIERSIADPDAAGVGTSERRCRP